MKCTQDKLLARGDLLFLLLSSDVCIHLPLRTKVSLSLRHVHQQLVKIADLPTGPGTHPVRRIGIVKEHQQLLETALNIFPDNGLLEVRVGVYLARGTLEARNDFSVNFNVRLGSSCFLDDDEVLGSVKLVLPPRTNLLCCSISRVWLLVATGR